MPALQVVQVTNELAALLYFPASQLTQLVAPTEEENFPAAQSAHTPVDALSKYLPALHDEMHSDEPAVLHIPEAQSAQSATVFVVPPR